jgi:hypothetical protein
MPAPSTTDWPAVKATAIARNSIKEAAALHNVPYDAAKQRACREKWPVGRRLGKAVQEAKSLEQAQLVKVNPSAVTSVTSTADALVTALAEDNRETRMSLSSATRKAARSLQGMPGGDIVNGARKLKDVVSSAGIIHGWNESGNDQGADMLILSIGGNVNLGGQQAFGQK